MTIAFTAVNQHGTYSPRNVGAVWIVDSSGKFVKTLTVWAFIRAIYLQKWYSSSGPTPSMR